MKKKTTNITASPLYKPWRLKNYWNLEEAMRTKPNLSNWKKRKPEEDLEVEEVKKAEENL